jgi:DNA-binding Lrp family transcriptional regulator
LLREFALFLQLMAKEDRITDQILRELELNGRISNIDLADRVGLSPSACLRRVQDLERSGVITGYRAVVDPVARGAGFIAYVTVGLSDHTKDAQDHFERAVARFSEVRECHNITGAVEYLLRIETADLAGYKLFHTEKLGMLAQVRQIVTHVVIGSPKDERG